MQSLAPKHVKALLMTAFSAGTAVPHTAYSLWQSPLRHTSFCTLPGVLVFWKMYNQLYALEQAIALSPPYGAA